MSYRLDGLAFLVLALLAAGVLFAIYDSRVIRFTFAVIATLLAILWAGERVLA